MCNAAQVQMRDVLASSPRKRPRATVVADHQSGHGPQYPRLAGVDYCLHIAASARGQKTKIHVQTPFCHIVGT